jgi:hypothetical protein
MMHPTTLQRPVSFVWWRPYLAYNFVDGARGDGPQAQSVDCYGLVRAAYQIELGISLALLGEVDMDHLTGLKMPMDDDRFTSDFAPVQTGFEQAFDVAVIRRPVQAKGRWITGWYHCGVVTRPAHILHIEAMKGAREECFRDTVNASASSTLRVDAVRLYRHKNLINIMIVAQNLAGVAA